MMFSGVHLTLNDFTTPGIGSEIVGDGLQTDWQAVHRVLRTIRNGQFLTAHFPARGPLFPLLDRLGFRTILMLRDPRDVVVSHAYYVTRSERHHLHNRYNALPTIEDRLMASIAGFPSDQHGRGLISIGKRLGGYMPWLQAPETYVCRFEDLVGPNGGGSDEAQRNEIFSIGRHVNRPLDEPTAQRLAGRIWSPRSSTFRGGRAGDWTNHFSQAHKAAFKELAGQYLIELGYESGLDW